MMGYRVLVVIMLLSFGCAGSGANTNVHPEIFGSCDITIEFEENKKLRVESTTGFEGLIYSPFRVMGYIISLIRTGSVSHSYMECGRSVKELMDRKERLDREARE